MTWFAVDTRYTDDRALLDAVRPAHRDHVRAMVDAGQVLGGGPWADDTGGFLVFKVADRAELDELLAEDPYTTEGVAVERTVREWKIVLGPWADA